MFSLSKTLFICGFLKDINMDDLNLRRSYIGTIFSLVSLPSLLINIASENMNRWKLRYALKNNGIVKRLPCSTNQTYNFVGFFYHFSGGCHVPRQRYSTFAGQCLYKLKVSFLQYKSLNIKWLCRGLGSKSVTIEWFVHSVRFDYCSSTEHILMLTITSHHPFPLNSSLMPQWSCRS